VIDMQAYFLLLQWRFRRTAAALPLIVVVQAAFALGVVLGFPLLLPSLDADSVLYLTTGAPAIALISLGLVGVPQDVSQAKVDGSLDFARSLPVPRVGVLLADLTVWLTCALPGMAVAVLAGALRFDLALHPSLLAIPIVLLVALTSSAVGYAIAIACSPATAGMISQVFAVLVLMFSPLAFPSERLPGWLAAVHNVLPIEAMGDLVRSALIGSSDVSIVGPISMLTAWAVGSVALAWTMMAKRR
jgi:ABC-2 type transport system permease protein